ncbi:MAG: DUF4143 domain-containing protein [Gammaproteobacteria bacterium]
MWQVNAGEKTAPGLHYYDLERPDDYRLISSDPLGFFGRRPQATILDEAQQYPELFQVLRGIIDQDRNTTGRYLLTGSSSPEIVKGLTESLAGRIATVELSPFKAAEFYEQGLPPVYGLLAQSKRDVAALLNLQPRLDIQQVYTHWLHGGYPEPRIKGEAVPEFYGLWMDQYFTDYIHRDIQRPFPRINVQTYRLFIQSLSFHSGNILNYSEIARALDVSSVTVKEYLEILHNTFLWRNLRSFERNSLKKVQKMPKGYFRDTGIHHRLLKIDTVDNLLLHPAAGASFESFVIEEIIRGFQCTMASGIDFYYYRTRDRSEIDLIIDAPFGLIPIEIKLGHKINHRRLTALRIFMSDTQAKLGILVNNAERIEQLTDTIIQIPARYL